MAVWFGFKYVNFLRALTRLCASKRTGRGYCLLLDLIRIHHHIYTISVFGLHYATFCKERVYSPCSFLIRESGYRIESSISSIHALIIYLALW